MVVSLNSRLESNKEEEEDRAAKEHGVYRPGEDWGSGIGISD